MDEKEQVSDQQVKDGQVSKSVDEFIHSIKGGEVAPTSIIEKFEIISR